MIPRVQLHLLLRLQDQMPGWYIRMMGTEKCVYHSIGPYGIAIHGGAKRPVRYTIEVFKEDPKPHVLERIEEINPKHVDIITTTCEVIDRYIQRAKDEGIYFAPPELFSEPSCSDIPF